MEEEANGTLPFMDVRFSREEQGTLSRQVYQNLTHTNRYLPFTSHHPVSVKSGVVACLASRAITVSSNNALRDKELKRIEKVLIENGYPKQFVTKNIRKQVKSSRKVIAKQQEESKVNVKIPLIQGLSQEVRRVARMVGIRCAFYTPFALRSLYSIKDKLPREKTTHAIYSVRCKTYDEE